MIGRSKLIVSAGPLFDPADCEVVLRPLDTTQGGRWFTTIADLPGCMGDGETEMDAIEDVRVGALNWADSAISAGDSIQSAQCRNAWAAE